MEYTKLIGKSVRVEIGNSAYEKEYEGVITWESHGFIKMNNGSGAISKDACKIIEDVEMVITKQLSYHYKIMQTEKI